MCYKLLVIQENCTSWFPPSKSRKKKASSWAKSRAQLKMMTWQAGCGGNRSSGKEEGGMVVWAENVQERAEHWVQPVCSGPRMRAQECGCSLVRNFYVPLH